MHRQRMGEWMMESPDLKPFTAGIQLHSAKHLVRACVAVRSVSKASTSRILPLARAVQAFSFFVGVCQADKNIRTFLVPKDHI
jgi:hypothetical protein